MSENAIDSENSSKPAPDTKPRGARKAGKKARTPAKKASRVESTAGQSKGESVLQEGRGDRHDEARERRRPSRDDESTWLAAAHGAGFVSILGKKGGEKIESSKNAAGERTYKIGK